MYFFMVFMFDERGCERKADKCWRDRYTTLYAYLLHNLSNRLHQPVTGCMCHHKYAPLE